MLRGCVPLQPLDEDEDKNGDAGDDDDNNDDGGWVWFRWRSSDDAELASWHVRMKRETGRLVECKIVFPYLETSRILARPVVSQDLE